MADAGGTVLRDVSISLGALIRANVFIEKPGDVDVEYHSPANEEAGIQGRRPLILVYLYRLSDNAYLRNTPATIVRTKNGFVRRAAPAVVDLLYLMVAYAQNAELELILIDRLKRLFSDVAVLEGDALKGGLRSTGNDYLTLVPDNLSLNEIHQLWGSFPSKPYRLSLFYTVSPVSIPRLNEEPVQRVYEVTSTYQVPVEPDEKAKE
ncbi:MULTISPECIES: DUF4255 domain-containing protein [Corallococcus]|uniref:DUF4255 domain-containing protein n=1 Tax=Corallococcus llansteffanensis TaxID=2316731 RepID=A0A3A8NDT9_9BACT|nr:MULTISPECIES: DUF4255 domain-containing protein [Corallococcus]RKH00538.1 DUF4255 domain-containing protein [Corallococcus sp. CA053C]RKH42418.1 DUF4255 domain-containing protein [Corallococcus llansteffanensis]